MWVKAVIGHFEVLFEHMFRDTEENHETFQ
jgi:hypothetical protein